MRLRELEIPRLPTHHWAPHLDHVFFFPDQVGLTIMDVNDSAKDFNWKTRYSNRYVTFRDFCWWQTCEGLWWEMDGNGKLENLELNICIEDALSQMLQVWNMYLHLPHKLMVKYHTWSNWATFTSCNISFFGFNAPCEHPGCCCCFLSMVNSCCLHFMPIRIFTLYVPYKSTEDWSYGMVQVVV